MSEHSLYNQPQDDGRRKPLLRCEKSNDNITFNNSIMSMIEDKVDYCPFCGEKLGDLND